MKALYLLPFLFLGACSKSKDPDPATVEHTAEVQYRLTYDDRNSLPTGAYLPSLGGTNSSTQEGFFLYQLPWTGYSLNSGYKKAMIGKYKGAANFEVDLSLPKLVPYVDRSPAIFRLEVALVVDGKVQPKALDVNKAMISTNDGLSSSIWTIMLTDKEVVL